LKIFAEGFANNEMFLVVESIQPSDEVATNLTEYVPSALMIGFVTSAVVALLPSGNVHLYVNVFPNPTLVALVNTNEFVFSHWLSSLMLNCGFGLGEAATNIALVSVHPSALVTTNETIRRPGVK
jgi:hypothetical protein